MKLHFLRAACCILESGSTSILTDPWLDDGIYYGSFAHYPPYEWKDDFSGLKYIYISHIHPDHFSPGTMKRLPKVPVLIHNFKAPFLKKNIEALGFEVIELEHAKEYDIGDMKIAIYAADGCDPQICGKFFGCAADGIVATQIDSLAVFSDHKHVVVNANDCPYQLSKALLPKLRLQYPEIDLLMVAYAGAGPYPQCFAMEDEAKKHASNTKKQMFISHARWFAQGLRAKRTFPFAGDYVLQGRLSNLNDYRGVATIEEVFHGLEKTGVKCLKLSPGTSCAVSEQPDSYVIPDEASKQEYVSRVLKSRVYDFDLDTMPTYSDIAIPMMESAVRLERKRQELGFRSDTKVYIPIGREANACIRLDGKPSTIETRLEKSKYIKMTVDPRLLMRILNGPRHAHWNNAEIGSHIQFERSPDVFERGIHHLMSFLHC